MAQKPIRVNIRGVDFRRGGTSWSINGKRYGVSSELKYNALLEAMDEEEANRKKGGQGDGKTVER